MAEASSSKLPSFSNTATTDELLALSSQLLDLSKTESIGQLYRQEKQKDEDANKRLEATLFEQAPSYVKLHNDLQSSRGMLGELESFLNVFYNDLNVLSNQMSQLQSKSILLGQRLKNRRQLEGRLRTIVSDMVLEPKYIELIFADEATAGRAGLEVWKGCAERLSACLIACAELEGVLRDQLGSAQSSSGVMSPSGQPPVDAKALKEAREVAEGCRLMAASKIRPLLISTFAPLRSSLATNMPILQAVLLKSYRPLFMFLSHHAPRVAIDVQRAYVAAARLYFETGFRRYERSLGHLRDREKSKRGESSTSSLSFIDPAGKSAGLSTFGGLSGSSSSTTTSDPWAPDVSQLDNAKIADGPAVTLAYLADDSSYRTSYEALFRSLSLTFLDNASSEYCFLARFFEGIDLEANKKGKNGGSASESQITGSSAVKVRHADAHESVAGKATDTDDGPLPEESASAQGDLDDEEGDGVAPEEEQGTVTRLSALEKSRIGGRGALDELWKQVMEPVVGTYTKFVTSIIALHPPLIPLYTMLKLNDCILAEVEIRGVSSVLQGNFMSFKLKAWPMMQKQFDEAIESVKKLKAGSAGVGGGAAMAAAASSLFGGFFGGSSQQGSANQTANGGTDNVIHLVCTRYARLFSTIVHLNNFSEDGQDTMVFNSLTRLRGELEGVLENLAKSGTSETVTTYYRLIRTTIESGPAGIILPRVQAEMSHWTEAERSHRNVVK
jgi:vacuolar protein sorting-associated protein 52